MLASRILQAAEGVVSDYQTFKVSELLQQAAACSSRQMPVNQTLAAAKQISSSGKRLAEESKIRLYPQQMTQFLNASAYNSALPERIGRFLESGFGSDIASMPHTPEVQDITQLYHSAHSELNALISTLRKLDTQPLEIPTDRLSVDFVVPRAVVGNDTRELLKLQEKFCDLVAYLNEFVGADEVSPKLVYTSTTDPVIAIALVAKAAYAVIKLFGGMLVVARSAVELYRAVKLLQAQTEMKQAAETMISSIEPTVRTLVEKMVHEQLKGLEGNSDDGRKRELISAIVIRTEALVPKIAEGVSIGISVESVPTLKSIDSSELSAEQPNFIQLVFETRQLETKSRTAIAVAGGAENLRLTHNVDAPIPK